MSLRDGEGRKARSDEENAAILQPHLTKLYNTHSNSLTFDPCVLDSLPQGALMHELDDPPTHKEAEFALKAMHNGKAAGLNGLPIEVYKVLWFSSKEGAKVLLDILCQFWESGAVSEEWIKAKLCLLPKKGDLSDPNNWRGIMLLDCFAKWLGSILGNRLKAVFEKIGMESQNGFRPDRGCTDGLFTLKLALQKCKEHSVDTHTAFIDLVKAFDSVPRDGMWAVLRKLGIPSKFVNLVAETHSPSIGINVPIGDVDIEISNNVGVLQGSTHAPILFIFYMHAVFLTMHQSWPEGVLHATFKTKEGGEVTGVKFNAKGTAFDLWNSLFADDAALVALSREDLGKCLRLVDSHFKRFGLRMHVGARATADKPAKSSKTLCLLIRGTGNAPLPGDTDAIDLGNGAEVTYCQDFKYLGGTLDTEASDVTEITKRIRSASSIFGMMTKRIFGDRQISLVGKVVQFRSIVLGILLYGSETWTVTAALRRRLRVFYAKCIRIMYGITRNQQWKKRISNEKLREKLGLQSIDEIIDSRCLRWVGHVIRMNNDRLPKQILNAWVPVVRRVGRPYKTYGQGLIELLRNRGLEKEIQQKNWQKVALDRDVWKTVVDGTYVSQAVAGTRARIARINALQPACVAPK